MTAATIDRLVRPSGAFAMLAVDQREALRAMIQERVRHSVGDEQVTDFKVAAARALTPFASTVLIDKQYHQVDAVIDSRECGLEPTTGGDFSGSVPEVVRRGTGDPHGSSST